MSDWLKELLADWRTVLARLSLDATAPRDKPAESFEALTLLRKHVGQRHDA